MNELLRRDPKIREAVTQAQQFALKKPLRIGALVAHPNELVGFELRSVDEKGIATVGCPDPVTRQDVIKQFPLAELFDPNVAGDIAKGITVSDK